MKITDSSVLKRKWKNSLRNMIDLHKKISADNAKQKLRLVIVVKMKRDVQWRRLILSRLKQKYRIDVEKKFKRCFVKNNSYVDAALQWNYWSLKCDFLKDHQKNDSERSKKSNQLIDWLIWLIDWLTFWK